MANNFTDTCSTFWFVTFVFCATWLFLSFSETLLSQQSPQLASDVLDDLDFDTEFQGSSFTYKCEYQKCVRTLSKNDDITSQTTCNMMCADPPIWPKPTNLKISNKDSSIIDIKKVNFNFSAENLVKIMLQNATDLFIKNLEFLKSGNQSTPSFELNIRIILLDLNTDRLKLNTNESYQLTVQKEKNVTANIFASNYFGARHGLETLSQLIWYDEIINEVKIIHDVVISDSPKFPYRGVMVDTARNYFPMSLIKKVVDGMAMSKLNVLHLHLTDSASFSIVLPSVKKMAYFGAYGPSMIYTPEDVKDLIQYSLLRGIRVLLEVDAPSHVNAGWNFNQNKKYVICDDIDFLNGQLNPDNEETLEILEHIYKDLLELVDDEELFHIGSDEVDLNCWRTTEAAKKSNLVDNMTKFWAQFTNKMLEKLKNANDGQEPEHIIMWSSPLTESKYLSDLVSNVTVQVWLGNPERVLRTGHNVIYSTVGHWYLDCGFGPWHPSKKSGVCDPYTSWEKVYGHRPWYEFGHRELSLGGEVCLWSEQVSVDTLETRVWPRSGAFAERVWSDLDRIDIVEVSARFVTFIERLRQRGIKSAGIWPQWCSQNPGKC